MILSAILSDRMILQRDKELKLWGVSGKGALLSCQMKHTGESGVEEEVFTVKADDNGRWLLKIPPHQAGGPYEITLNDGIETVIHDVLFGDVWLLGGQSNMEIPISRTLDLYAEEAAVINDPDIRMFEVPKEYDFHNERENINKGQWIPAVKEHIMGFSAAGYFFAKDLKERHKIPIGLVQTAVGGTPIQAWIPEKSLRMIGGFDEELDACKSEAYVRDTISRESEETAMWMKQAAEQDGRGGLPDWKKLYVPGLWRHMEDGSVHELSNISGCIWLKKEFDVPEQIYQEAIDNGGLADMLLGAMIDADEVFVNGIRIGGTGYRYPPRKYSFSADILKPGRNELKIRLMVYHGGGGFVPDKRYQLVLGSYSADLSGIWEYQIGTVMKEFPVQTPFQYKPSGCYNAMIHPLKNYKFSGICFYQGESNTGNPEGYQQLFTTLVNDWRELFDQGCLPFLYVQLANFSDGVRNSCKSGWARLREEQRRGLIIPNTAMAVSIDAGEYNDLHPQNKKAVGRRLALGARKLRHGEDIVISGPAFIYQVCLEDRIVLHFDSVGSGLLVHGESLNGFEICGEDGIYRPARAVIEGNTVEVFPLEELVSPRSVRYAWLDNPEGANLYNKEELPASPFITI